MSFTQLSPGKMKRWNHWLWFSHKLTELPGHIVYRWDFGGTYYLTPIRQLPDLLIRQERDMDGLIATFEIANGVRTVANLWGDKILDLHKLQFPGDLRDAKQRVLDAASEGRLWWGTDRLKDSFDLTSICYIFEKDASFPGSIKKDLNVDDPSIPFETKLQLV